MYSFWWLYTNDMKKPEAKCIADKLWSNKINKQTSTHRRRSNFTIGIKISQNWKIEIKSIFNIYMYAYFNLRRKLIVGHFSTIQMIHCVMHSRFLLIPLLYLDLICQKFYHISFIIKLENCWHVSRHCHSSNNISVLHYLYVYSY